MATGFDASIPIADGAIYTLIDNVGAIRLTHVETVSTTHSGGWTEVPGPAGMVGIQQAPGGFVNTFTVRRAKGANEEVDYDGLMDTGTLVEFNKQILGGVLERYFNCGVHVGSASEGADGSVTREVTLTCIKRQIVTP